MKIFVTKFIAIIFICQSIFILNAFAIHKYHTSLTRIDYNAEEKLLEVSIKVFSDDLLQTLEKRQKKKVDLETTKDIDQILQNYLAEKFILKTKSGDTKSFKWIGKELETDEVHFYLEIPFEGDLEGAEIKNTLFFEKFREQVNLVHINYQDKKSNLVFKIGDKFKTITENQTESK